MSSSCVYAFLVFVLVLCVFFRFFFTLVVAVLYIYIFCCFFLFRLEERDETTANAVCCLCFERRL